jgi:hypothetical protein
MSAVKESTLKTDIEQACIHSFIPTNTYNWTPTVTPQLDRFAQFIRDAIKRYVTTPSFQFVGVVPPLFNQTSGMREYTLTHNLGYLPIINPVEKEEVINFVTVFRVSNSTQINRPEIVQIDSTIVTVSANIGDTIRVTMW